MSRCDYCDQDMLTSDGCTVGEFTTFGPEPVPRIPYGRERGMDKLKPSERCHDCNAVLGRFHHPGCDVEECVRPGQRLDSDWLLGNGQRFGADGEFPTAQDCAPVYLGNIIHHEQTPGAASLLAVEDGEIAPVGTTGRGRRERITAAIVRRPKTTGLRD